MEDKGKWKRIGELRLGAIGQYMVSLGKEEGKPGKKQRLEHAKEVLEFLKEKGWSDTEVCLAVVVILHKKLSDATAKNEGMLEVIASLGNRHGWETESYIL